MCICKMPNSKPALNLTQVLKGWWWQMASSLAFKVREEDLQAGGGFTCYLLSHSVTVLMIWRTDVRVRWEEGGITVWIDVYHSWCVTQLCCLLLDLYCLCILLWFIVLRHNFSTSRSGPRVRSLGQQKELRGNSVFYLCVFAQGHERFGTFWHCYQLHSAPVQNLRASRCVNDKCIDWRIWNCNIIFLSLCPTTYSHRGNVHFTCKITPLNRYFSHILTVVESN